MLWRTTKELITPDFLIHSYTFFFHFFLLFLLSAIFGDIIPVPHNSPLKVHKSMGFRQVLVKDYARQ